MHIRNLRAREICQASTLDEALKKGAARGDISYDFVHGFLTKGQVPGDALAEGNSIEETIASPGVECACADSSAGPVLSKKCDEA